MEMINNLDWLTVMVGAIFLLGFLIGIYRGAIKIAVSLATTIVTLVIVVFATPYIVGAVEKYTPVDDLVQKQVSSTVADLAKKQLVGEEENGLTKENVKKVLGAAGVTEAHLRSYGIEIEDIVDGKVTGKQLAEFGISESILDGIKNNDNTKQMQEAIENAELTRDEQVAAIENANMPTVFKNLLSVNNNNEIYSRLGVDTFGQYVGRFLSKLLIHIFAFLGTFLFVTIVLRAIVFALDIISELPVLGFLNRFAGGLVGMGAALIIVWFLFLILTLMYTTSIGKDAFEIIQKNEILSMIYEYNPIMHLAVNFK